MCLPNKGSIIHQGNINKLNLTHAITKTQILNQITLYY